MVGQLPVVLRPRRVVIPPERRVEVIVDHAERRRAEQERCDRVAAERVRGVEDPLRKPAVERQDEQVAVDLARIPGQPQVETAPHVVRALHPREVRLQAEPGGRLAVAGVTTEVLVLRCAAGRRTKAARRARRRHEIEPRKDFVGKLIDERRRKAELGRVEVQAGIGPRELEILIQPGANIHDQRRAQRPDPVGDAAVVDAPERQLAVLGRSAQDAVGAALLGSLVVRIAHEHLRPVADVLIDFGREVAEGIEGEVRREDKVVAPGVASARRCGVGLQEVLREPLRERIDATGRDPIVRERIPDPLTVLQPARCRVVDRDQTALSVAQIAEVAAELRRVGHGVGGRVRRRFLVSLIAEHEERLVPAVVQAWNLHRAIDLETVLIQFVIRFLLVVHFEEVLVRVEPFPPCELVHGAAQLVRARLQRHVHDAAGGAAVLRIVAVGDDLEFLDRVDRRHVGDVVAALNRVVRRAVEQELVVAVLTAVDRPVGNRAVVEGALVDGGTVVGDAGRQVGQHERVARVERQLVDAIVVDHQPAIGLGGFEDRRFRDDADLLAQFAELELKVHRGGLAQLEAHVRLTDLSEPGELRCHGVETGFQKRNGVHALGGGGGGRELSALRVGGGDDRSWNDEPVRIGDATGDRGAEFLGGGGAREEQRQDERDARDDRTGRDPHTHLPPDNR